MLRIAYGVGTIKAMLKNSLTPFFSRFWFITRLVFWLVLWLFALSMLLFYLVRWFSGDYFAPVRAISYVLPWLLALLVPSMLIVGMARRKWLLVTLAIPTLAICSAFVPLFLPYNSSPPTDGLSLKVMSHNLFFRQNAGAILTVIRQEQPDILLLQEIHPDLISMPLSELADLYPELYVDVVNQPEKGFIQAILSRYPITRINAEFDKGRAQKVVVETPAGSIAVWNIHLLPPFRILPQWNDQQAVALVTDITHMDGPLVVAGDFNATSQSATYRAVNRHLNNAHWEAGWGFGFTFPAPPHTIKELPINTGLLYQIDHVFYSDHFVAYNAYTSSTSGGSDHLPVVAELLLKQ